MSASLTSPSVTRLSFRNVMDQAFRALLPSFPQRRVKGFDSPEVLGVFLSDKDFEHFSFLRLFVIISLEIIYVAMKVLLSKSVFTETINHHLPKHKL